MHFETITTEEGHQLELGDVGTGTFFEVERKGILLGAVFTDGEYWHFRAVRAWGSVATFELRTPEQAAAHGWALVRETAAWQAQ